MVKLLERQPSHLTSMILNLELASPDTLEYASPDNVLLSPLAEIGITTLGIDAGTVKFTIFPKDNVMAVTFCQTKITSEHPPLVVPEVPIPTV